MFFTRWGMMHSDYQLNNMPLITGSIQRNRLNKTLKTSVNNWIISGFATIGAAKSAPAIWLIINGLNGYFSSCSKAGLTASKEKPHQYRNLLPSSKKKETSIMIVRVILL